MVKFELQDRYSFLFFTFKAKHPSIAGGFMYVAKKPANHKIKSVKSQSAEI